MLSSLTTTAQIQSEVEARHPELRDRVGSEQRAQHHPIRRSLEALRRITR